MASAARRDVWITGLGLVTPLGVGRAASWHGFCAGKPAVGPIRSYDARDQPVQLAGEVPDSFEAAFAGLQLPPPMGSYMGRFSKLALLAGQEALADSGLQAAEQDRARIGVAMGVGGGAVHYMGPLESAMRAQGNGPATPDIDEVMDRSFVVKTMLNAPASLLTIVNGFAGPSMILGAACSSGAEAVVTGMDWIRSGRADTVLAGGADATVSLLTLLAYHRAGVLTESNGRGAAASRPFDHDRDGFVMAEGAAALVLESAERARARGAPVYARIRGSAVSSEAFHLAAPRPDGSGIAATMRGALADADLASDELSHVLAHATSTVRGDEAEALALQQVFGSALGRLPVSAPKSLFGHAIGASSAIQIALAALSVREGVLTPTANCERPDPDVGLKLFAESREAAVSSVLCNAFGFGGHNVCVVVGEVD